MGHSSSCGNQSSPLVLLLRVFLVGSVFLVTVSISAQRQFFQEYNIRDGLAASKVYSVAEDFQGFLWLGTANGVSKFDGLRFQNFTVEDGLAPEGVRTIFQDSRGVVWFGHYEGGISRYINGKFENVVLPGLKGEGDIYDFTEPQPGELWIASNGLGAIHISNIHLVKENWRIKQFMGAEGLGDRVFDVEKTGDGGLYFVTDAGVKKLEGDSSFSFYKPGGMSNMFQLTCMFEDRNEVRWFGTHNGGLYKYSPGSSDIEIIDVLDGLAHNFVFCLEEDDFGNVWAGTYGGGVSVISPDGIIRTINNESGLPDERIQCLSKDRENNMLIGSNDNGLLVFKSFQFQQFPLPDQYNVRRFSALAANNDDVLWIGTEQGLFKANKQCNKFKQYTVADGLLDPRINSLAIDQQGVIWVGTEFGGLYSFLPEVGQFRSHFFLNQYITQSKVTDLCIDSDNRLWVGTLDGLLSIDQDRQQLERFSQGSGLAGNQISSLYSLSSGAILVGMVGRGMALIEGDSVSMILTEGSPSCFLQDNDGKIWVGMEGQGIYQIEKDKSPVHLTVGEGLLSNSISALNEDEFGNVWIGSSLGLSKFHKSTGQITHFGLSGGFGGVEVKKQASIHWQGNLWYGTSNGIYRNQPEKAKEAYPPGPIYFQKVLVNDQQFTDTGRVDLSFDQNELAFEFGSVSLTDPQNVWFQTFLEGRDERWSNWTQQTSAVYPALAEGVYSFSVRVRNRWGVQKTATLPVQFTIHPPWYRSRWFYLLASFSLVLLLVGFIKLRERNLRRDKRILAEKVRIRTREVVEKSEELEKKNNAILDSINYARRIQEAILVPDSVIASYGLDVFVMYKPKDIVSGDFYWFNKIGSKILFAAVDCTGHGVPGAFMSVVGYSLLDKIANELDETRPEVILQKVSLGVEKFLRQKDYANMPKDGMDMALAVYDEKTSVLEYAGAFNPLYVVRKGVLKEFHADRFSVGSYEQGSEKHFTRHTIKIEPDDTAYVFSDGFVDQFGGPDYKKFKSRNFKKLLSDIAQNPVDRQKSTLIETLETWKGNVEQLDDILVIGVKF